MLKKYCGYIDSLVTVCMRCGWETFLLRFNECRRRNLERVWSIDFVC